MSNNFNPNTYKSKIKKLPFLNGIWQELVDANKILQTIKNKNITQNINILDAKKRIVQQEMKNRNTREKVHWANMTNETSDSNSNSTNTATQISKSNAAHLRKIHPQKTNSTKKSTRASNAAQKTNSTKNTLASKSSSVRRGNIDSTGKGKGSKGSNGKGSRRSSNKYNKNRPVYDPDSDSDDSTSSNG